MKAAVMACIALLAVGSSDCLMAQTAAAGKATLQVRVMNMQGNGVANAVISLRPGERASLPPLPAYTTVVMDQKRMAFVPQVLVVRTGTRIVFPNSDHIHHDVYSFSPAKKFDTNLRPGAETKPVVFGKPGVVVLGCNIHDWMLGFIDVVNTPYFGKSDASGRVVLRHLPAGHYRMHVWQPRMNGVTRDVSLVLQAGERVSRRVRLSLHAAERSNRAPAYLLNQPTDAKPH